MNGQRNKPVDMAKRLKTLGDKSVHNAFHYEVLSFAKDTGNRKLASWFKKRLREIDRLMEHNVVS